MKLVHISSEQIFEVWKITDRDLEVSLPNMVIPDFYQGPNQISLSKGIMLQYRSYYWRPIHQSNSGK